MEKIKSCVGNNKYTIALNENRQENIEFINEYNIRSKKQKAKSKKQKAKSKKQKSILL
ncbi:MAG: hypothetical protein RR139_08740 [Lachnospiraceae bacterium]